MVDDVRVRHEPVFLTRRGRRVAAVIDVEDLERLTQVAEDLADMEAADAVRAEIAKHGTIPWDGFKAGLGIESAVGLREVTSQVCENPGESRRAVDRAERGQP
ncbi:type II toxin-antitoxin system Phd/YefM family antitoxin [Actinomyces oris]|uniref:type II toxin-antitoxin system Phd/YefM family antitoxin n=1 Tax=Actinomyces oris TaxID=544580 RepID=UPI0031BB6B5A